MRDRCLLEAKRKKSISLAGFALWMVSLYLCQLKGLNGLQLFLFESLNQNLKNNYVVS